VAEETTGTVAVIGAGTMGHGIAQVAALAGYRVRLFDAVPSQVMAAMARVRDGLDRGVERGRLLPERRDAALARLTAAPDLEKAVAGAGLVVEAVPERLELKRALFAELEGVVGAEALLASNTSSLSISAIASGTRRPERVVGVHFFNPVPVMRLVEVVRGRQTAPAAVEAAVEFARRLGKEPIVVADTPGFASSRLGVALGLEAMRMLEQGVASVQDIDRAMELGYNHPMGPLKLTDLIGLDVRLGIAEYLHAQLGAEQFRPPEILRRMVAEGRLGRKSGRGFYDWSER
jgi:3-hydroxybutyryl-CoA dehydrogenase